MFLALAGMAESAISARNIKVVCRKCGEESVVTVRAEGLHVFVCPACGQPHLLLLDANLAVRDFRTVSSVPVRKLFDVARLRVKEEGLVPASLRPFIEALKRGVLPPNSEEALELLSELGLVEVE